MKSIITIAFYGLFVVGCSTSPIFDYHSYSKPMTNSLGTLFWKDVYPNTSSPVGTVSSVLYLDTKYSPDNRRAVSTPLLITFIAFSQSSYNPSKQEECNDKTYKVNKNINSFSVAFNTLYLRRPDIFKENPKYQFNTSKVYLSKNGKQIEAKEIEILPVYNGGKLVSGTPYLESGKILNYSNKYFDNSVISYYESPFVCEDLDGVEVEIGGLYVNGVEAPPLRFKMNYKDFIKKRWPKP